MIDLGCRVLTGKLRGQLERCNTKNPDNPIAQLWMLTKGVLTEIALLAPIKRDARRIPLVLDSALFRRS